MQGASKQYRTVAGTVLTIEEKKSKNGKVYVRARVRDADDNIYKVTLWEERAHDFLSRKMLGKKGHFEGSVSEFGDISVKYFDSSEAPKARVFDNGDDIKKYMAEKGFVRIECKVSDGLTRKEWQHKRYCIKVNGQWELKMEYAMRVLGAKEVFQQLKAFAKDVKSLVSISPREFNQIMDSLLIVAVQANNDTVEIDDEVERDVETLAILGGL